MKILYEGAQTEITEKKSRFLTHTKPVKSEAEALAFLESIRKEHWNASHNCYAYVIGDRGQLQRCSDDGEPQGTAGRPMLDVLLGEEVSDLIVVVTRYFGGTLLGTGGLVRAYAKAAREGLESSILLEKETGLIQEAETDYNGIGKIQYLLGQEGIAILESDYTDVVRLKILIPKAQAESLHKALTEATSGKIKFLDAVTVFFGRHNNEIIFLD